MACISIGILNSFVNATQEKKNKLKHCNINAIECVCMLKDETYLNFLKPKLYIIYI